jgi:hypothetical protein
LYLATDLRKDIHEYKDEYGDKYDIETRDDDIGSSVFPCNLVRSILLSYFAPVVDLVREICPEFEKDIGKEKGDKEEYEKVSESISDKKEKGICNHLFPEDFTEDDGEEGFYVHSF